MKRLFEIIDRHFVIYILVTVLLFMAGINYLASIKLERIDRKTQAEHMQAREEFLKRVHGEDLVEDYKLVTLEQSTSPKYYPFVEYIETARNGKFVNVSNQGTRCHYPDRDLCTAKGGAKEIWIFGGSTTFGYGVKDNETIAAYLAESLPDYRIVNFGAASYYSTLERIRFENLLTEFPPPKAAVFIDGVNDFYYFNIPDKSAYTANLKAAEELIVNKPGPLGTLGNDVKALLRSLAISRLLDAKFGSAAKAPEVAAASREQILKAITRFQLNHSMVEAIGDKLGITVINVLQPTATYGVGHKTSRVPRENLNFGDHANSAIAYREMLAQNGELHNQSPHMLNLSNLGIKEAMYVDTVHYSPLFNKQIALEVFRKLLDLLKERTPNRRNIANAKQ